jgi:tetratricopeptide (TPR) repeat protein
VRIDATREAEAFFDRPRGGRILSLMLPLLIAVLLGDATSLIAAGDKALASRDLRAALVAYQDATREDPSSAAVFVRLAGTYAKMGHDAEAIEWFQHALRIDSRSAAAQMGVAAARERLAILSPPKPRIDEAGARERYTAAVALINERKYGEALTALDDALRRKPGYGVALVARGSAQMGLLHYEAAAADYAAARSADPSLASPLFGLAEAYRAMGQPQKAAELYREYATSAAVDVQPQLKEYAARNAQALASQ